MVSKKGFFYALISLAIATLFGYLSFWKVFENDIFWQIRAGEEILHGLGVQTVDHWSSTAYLKPWFNFQWLSTVVFSAVAQLGSARFEELPLLRSILVTLDFALLSYLFWRLIGNFKRAAIFLLLFSPVYYIILSGRLELRPDIFGILMFLVLNILWASSGKLKAKTLGSLGILVLWANFHSGTVPFGIVFSALAFLFSDEASSLSEAKKFLALFLFALTWICTPIGPHIFEVLKSVAITYDWTLIGNPDHMPFHLSLLDPARGGPVFILWMLLSLLAGVSLAFKAKKLAGNLDGRTKFLALGFLFFTVMTFARIRSRPYAVIFLTPLLVDWIGSRLDQRRMQIAAGVFCVFFWFYLLPTHMHGSPETGYGMNEAKFPVRAAEFIASEKPAKGLYNYYDFGGYLVDRLRDYPCLPTDERSFSPTFFRKKRTL